MINKTFVDNPNGSPMSASKKKMAKWIVIAVLIVIVAAIFLTSCLTVVSAGHTGVVVRLGAVSDEVLSEGLHVKVPFVTNVVQMDNRVQKAEVDSTSASKDLQNVSSTIAVNYRLNQASSASLYKNVGINYEDIIIKPAIQECVKAVTAQFTAEELITQRQSVGDQMRDLLAEKITPYGLTIEIFNIISFEFSEEFNAAIEAKQTAQQNALKAEQDLARIKVEAEQKIEQARAEAESYKLKNQEITQETLAMEWINKWDGKLPTVAGDSQMMLNISELLESARSSANSSDSTAPASSVTDDTASGTTGGE